MGITGRGLLFTGTSGGGGGTGDASFIRTIPTLTDTFTYTAKDDTTNVAISGTIKQLTLGNTPLIPETQWSQSGSDFTLLGFEGLAADQTITGTYKKL